MPLIVGHRGARDLWPENSLSGFRRLLALGVEAVEFDVQQTRDGELVVIHDPTLDRTTGSRGVIAMLDAAQVLAAPLRAGPGTTPPDPGECVPTLDAVLALFAPTRLELHVEIKTDVYGELPVGAVENIVGRIRQWGLQQRTLLTCFVPEVLDGVRQAWPQARVLASLDQRSAEMLGGLDRALERLAAMPGCVVAVEKKLLAAAWSRCFDRLGGERLGVWVVNEDDDLRQWLAQPLRQITTDRPDRALAARSEAHQGRGP